MMYSRERRRCGARTRAGPPCRRKALPQNARCLQHGGVAGRPPGYPEHPRSKAARLEGRRRWVDRMNAAKARGEIERFPNGRRAKGLPKLSSNRKIRRAQRILEAAMATRAKKAAAVPAVAQREWASLDKAEQLAEATSESLTRVYDFLLQQIDPVEDPKMFALQISTALATISNQIRLDSAALLSRSGGALSQDERDRLDWAHRRWQLLAAEEAEKLEDEVGELLPPAAAE